MRDKLRQSFALLPPCSEPWIWIAKPSESSVEKLIGRRRLPPSTLSIKGPAKNELRKTIMISSHRSEPMVNKCRLSDSSPSNDGNDVDFPVCPRAI